MKTGGAWVRAVLAATLALGCGGQEGFEGQRAGAGRTIGGVLFRWAPAGRFRMGSPAVEAGRRGDEGPAEVTLTRGFWMGQFEVTQGQWRAVMGEFPKPQDKGTGDEYPVHWVSYVEAEEFCRRLTERAWAAGELPREWEIRLPTEAQWEYACRAGTATATAFGERLGDGNASFHGGARPEQASRVGSYAANAWGIFDMHGNEWEWVRDWYHAQLPGGADPDLSAEKGTVNRDGTYSRVRRGGAWIEEEWACRSAMRLRYEPERRSDHIGFRAAAVRRQGVRR